MKCLTSLAIIVALASPSDALGGFDENPAHSPAAGGTTVHYRDQNGILRTTHQVGSGSALSGSDSVTSPCSYDYYVDANGDGHESDDEAWVRSRPS